MSTFAVRKWVLAVDVAPGAEDVVSQDSAVTRGAADVDVPARSLSVVQKIIASPAEEVVKGHVV